MAAKADVRGSALVAGRYRLREKLGRGGMGEVFEAFDESEGRTVAIKLPHNLSGEEGARARLRFRREFHVLASLRHPRIVTAYDFGTFEGKPFYTMELLDGRNLKGVVRLGSDDTCRMLGDVAAALAMIHGRGLVHRDLAAKNVQRLANGRAKLMDFGVLANIGAMGEVAGTGVYIAPEGYRGLPVDARTDLYSLGVLGFILLTGRAPYPGKTEIEVALSWQRGPPRPPSAYASGISPALDELIVSLVSFEPSARPSSAAEVMARLSGITGVDDEASMDVRACYLASAPLVGRDVELSEARDTLAALPAGRGEAWVLSAESGAGKSRLLHELGLEAKLTGAIVATASCTTAAVSPFATIDDLAASLLRAAPSDAIDAAGPSLGALARVLPALRSHVRGKVAPRAEDPGEERMRVQRAIADWLFAFTMRTPIVFLIDDVQRCDEASAAALAALARQAPGARLFVVAAQRAGEATRATAAIDALRRSSRVIPLGGLSETSMQDLVRGLFGDVANVTRLASQLFSTTGGSPMHAMEVARGLVDDGTIAYKDGFWVIPTDVRIDHAPKTLADAMNARVAALPPAARTLGEALAVAGGSLSLDLVADLSDSTHASAESSGRVVDRALVALDALTESGILLGDGERYRFRHDSAREALLRGLPPERHRALCKRIGERLSEEPDAEERAAEIGFLLLDGGEVARGAEMLANAGAKLFEAQALADCIAPLEAALAAIEGRGASKIRTMEIRAMLLAAGWVSNRAVGSKHALAVVKEFREQAGIATADRLRGLGRPLALVVGMSLAWLRWILSPPKARGPNPFRSLVTFAVSLSLALGLANAENRKEDLPKLTALVRPFATFRGRAPWAVYLVAHAIPDILMGRLRSAAARFTEALPIFQHDPITRPAERDFAEAGLRGMRVLVDVNQFDPRVHEDCDAIDALGFRYWRLVVQATKAIRHRYRGEEEKARGIERAMEIPSIQLGSWSTDIQILMFSHPAYALCHDVLGLERCIAAFERLIPQGFRFDVRLAITRGEWQRERGNAAEAVAILESPFRALDVEDRLFRQWLGSALAEAYLAAERYDEARDTAKGVLAFGDDDEGAIVLPWLRCKRILALSLAALGDTAAARALLHDGLAQSEAIDCPPLVGAMHEGLARLALADDDAGEYHRHANEMLQVLRPTENPALIAFAERLLDIGKDTVDPTEALAQGPTLIDTVLDSPGPRKVERSR